MTNDTHLNENVHSEDLIQEDILTLEKESDLQTEIETLRQDVLRAMAETENVRKRAQRDREETARFAISGFARDLTDVCENLHRALSSTGAEQIAQNEALKTLHEGVSMTERALQTTLEKHGMKRIDPMGMAFDPQFHQAMFEIESNDHPQGTVIQVLEAGYVLHDRLIKPALVGVSKTIRVEG